MVKATQAKSARGNLVIIDEESPLMEATDMVIVYSPTIFLTSKNIQNSIANGYEECNILSVLASPLQTSFD